MPIHYAYCLSVTPQFEDRTVSSFTLGFTESPKMRQILRNACEGANDLCFVLCRSYLTVRCLQPRSMLVAEGDKE